MQRPRRKRLVSASGEKREARVPFDISAFSEDNELFTLKRVERRMMPASWIGMDKHVETIRRGILVGMEAEDPTRTLGLRILRFLLKYQRGKHMFSVFSTLSRRSI